MKKVRTGTRPRVLAPLSLVAQASPVCLREVQHPIYLSTYLSIYDSSHIYISIYVSNKAAGFWRSAPGSARALRQADRRV